LKPSSKCGAERNREKEAKMPRKGSKHPYKPRREYRYSVKDIAELAGMTRNALNVAKVRGKIDPGNLRSVVSFLFRTIIERRFSGDLFVPASGVKKRSKKRKRGAPVSRRKTKRAAKRK
jgi:hypothetical protein